MKVSMRKKKIKETDERDERATAFTLSIYRDWAFAIVVFQIAFARGNFASSVISSHYFAQCEDTYAYIGQEV